MGLQYNRAYSALDAFDLHYPVFQNIAELFDILRFDECYDVELTCYFVKLLDIVKLG